MHPVLTMLPSKRQLDDKLWFPGLGRPLPFDHLQPILRAGEIPELFRDEALRLGFFDLHEQPGSVLYDRSPYGHNGTIVGAALARLASGLWYPSFDGIDDKVTFGSPPGLQLGDSPLAIVAWVMQTGKLGAWRYVSGGSVNRAPELGFSTGNKLMISLRAIVDIISSGPAHADLNVWHLAGMVRSQGAGTWDYTFYWDGAVDGTASDANAMDGPGNFFVGASGGASYWFQGGIIPVVITPDIAHITAAWLKSFYHNTRYLFGL